jgi:hypothetical protein
MIELLCPYLLCNKGFGQILSFKDEGMRDSFMMENNLSMV